MSTLSRLPLVKGGRGMFHRTCDAMRTEHPPSPLHKGEVKVSSSILLPKRNLVKSWPNMRLFFFHRFHNIHSFLYFKLLADTVLMAPQSPPPDWHQKPSLSKVPRLLPALLRDVLILVYSFQLNLFYFIKRFRLFETYKIVFCFFNDKLGPCYIKLFLMDSIKPTSGTPID